MKTTKKKASAITGDVIGSGDLPPSKRKLMQNKLQQFSEFTAKQFSDIKIQQYRGDSIQAILTTNRAQALRIALQLQFFLQTEDIKIRLGVGLGEISFQGRDVITSDGTALQLSGTLVDELKRKNELIAIVTTNAEFNKEWQIHSASLNFLIERLSAAQAEALYLLLQNFKQEDMAKKLNISQPSVHQRLQAAGANVIMQIVQRFELTVPLLY